MLDSTRKVNMAGLSKHLSIDKLEDSGITEALFGVTYIQNKCLREVKFRQKIATILLETVMNWNGLSELLLLINLLGNQVD
jgi:hypothetical protein